MLLLRGGHYSIEGGGYIVLSNLEKGICLRKLHPTQPMRVRLESNHIVFTHESNVEKISEDV